MLCPPALSVGPAPGPHPGGRRQNHRIPAWQGLAGTSVGPPAQPPAQAGSPRAGGTGPRPGGAGISPEKETPQPPWAAWARAPAPSEGRSSSSNLAGHPSRPGSRRSAAWGDDGSYLEARGWGSGSAGNGSPAPPTASAGRGEAAPVSSQPRPVGSRQAPEGPRQPHLRTSLGSYRPAESAGVRPHPCTPRPPAPTALPGRGTPTSPRPRVPTPAGGNSRLPGLSLASATTRPPAVTPRGGSGTAAPGRNRAPGPTGSRGGNSLRFGAPSAARGRERALAAGAVT